MDTPQNESLWSPPSRQETGFPGGSSVPPPPPEVKVRTMRSDLESMMKSGGMLPQFENIQAPALAVARGTVGGEDAEKNRTMIFVIVGVAVVVAIAIVYLVYDLYFKNGSQQSANTAPLAPQTPPQAAPPTFSFAHKSFFKKPTDQFLALTVQSTVQNAVELGTFSQRLVGLLSRADTAGTFFEIAAKNATGGDLDAKSIFDAANIGLLDGAFFSAHFVSDATFFVARDKNGSWPGIVLGLKPDENWLFLKNDVLQIEKSPNIANFFLSFPGDKVGGFRDENISGLPAQAGQPARVLTFTNPDTEFVYGWFRGYLVLSSSREGFKEALARL